MVRQVLLYVTCWTVSPLPDENLMRMPLLLRLALPKLSAPNRAVEVCLLGKAAWVVVRLRCDGRRLEATVSDDGGGHTRLPEAARGGGFGLVASR
ncbi:hypothetical protein BIV23_08390 [Streptomyces monashensis]|uniref:Uncharacterized protein n=1 Tax=Streptomyces monashensis TaxID=1678012 RepID=A0A1S2QJP7_9ACTN|nr:hypothetical protein BIV23_08390 [Streptomyces monashensis]